MLHERWAWMSVSCAAITASVLVSPACGLDAEGNDAATGTGTGTGAAGAATSTGTSAGASGPGSGGAGASSSSVGGSGGVPAGSGGTPATGGGGAEGGGGASSSSAGGEGDGGTGGLLECADPEVLCASGCADLLSDQANCGTCGGHCTGGSMCIDGKCEDCNGAICDTGESCKNDLCSCEFTMCQSNCVNTDYDANHCGACMADCSGTCVAGNCL
jgi:hypothetical protein